MAKKVKEASAEDRLAAALVPLEEQPYPVPENWCWVRMEGLYAINPKNTAADDIDAAFIPMEKISAGTNSYFEFEVQPWGKAKKGHTQFADGDVAFAKISPCFENGKSMMLHDLPNGIGGGTTELIVLRQPMVSQEYTYWLVSTSDFIRGGCRTYSGTVGQQRISMEYVKAYPVPLPPLSEQQRIVERIESLYAQLDEARDEAQAVIDGYEDRKAAILHKAFTGDLTVEWRKTNNTSLNDWQPVTSTKLFEYVTSGSRGWAQYYSDTGAVFIRMGNLDHGTIELDLSDIQHVKLPDKAEGQRSLIQKDDILISITADVGMIGLVREPNFEGYINQHVALARPVDKDSAEFIAWYLVSDVGLSQFQKRQRGATKVGLGLNDIRELVLNMPSKPEQHEIVRRLDSLLSQEAEVKAVAEATLDEISAMKQAILARAFRGELGTNDPNDEPAEELLKRILQA